MPGADGGLCQNRSFCRHCDLLGCFSARQHPPPNAIVLSHRHTPVQLGQEHDTTSHDQQAHAGKTTEECYREVGVAMHGILRSCLGMVKDEDFPAGQRICFGVMCPQP